MKVKWKIINEKQEEEGNEGSDRDIERGREGGRLTLDSATEHGRW